LRYFAGRHSESPNQHISLSAQERKGHALWVIRLEQLSQTKTDLGFTQSAKTTASLDKHKLLSPCRGYYGTSEYQQEKARMNAKDSQRQEDKRRELELFPQ
jgi:hypothetical protein